MLKVNVHSGDLAWIAPSARYLGECAAALGLDAASRAKLEEAIGASCANVVEHAYEPGEAIHYQLELFQEPSTLVVGIQDQGLPFDAAQLHPRIRQLVDQVRLVNLGRDGKRLELVVDLHEPDFQQHLTEADRLPDQHTLAAPAGQVTIRPACHDDAIPIARCVYRCYGDSYGSVYLYNPEKLRSLWQAGLVTSVVAVTADNELVGHLCYWLDDAHDLVGESTDAIVDPRYRGRHLFDQLKAQLVEHTRAQGRLGMVSEAVTVHPYSQKGILATGAIETGLMLGDLPSSLQFKGIEDKLPARQSCVLCYLRLNPEPMREVYLPRRHAPMLGRIYDRLGLSRQFSQPPPALGGEAKARLEVHLDEGWAEAALRVVHFGNDLESLFRSHLRHLLANGVPYIYAELPLSDPSVGSVVETLESMGFSFAGLVPELSQGDILRLHYLTNIEIDPNITVVTEWGAEIRDYVLAQAGPA